KSQNAAGRASFPRNLASRVEQRQHGFHIVHATAPRAATGLLKRGPQARVCRQTFGGRKIGARRTPGQNLFAFLGTETSPAFPNEIEAAFEFVPVDGDAQQIPLPELSDGTARQRLGADVPDARAGAYAAEARVGHKRDVLSEGQV